MASAAPTKFRIDVDIHNLLMNSASSGPRPAVVKAATLPEPVFPQYPELLSDPGPETPLEKRDWTYDQVWRKVRGWLLPYMRSRVMPGEFHPITACNLDCWYCWAYNNKTKGMTEDVARRAIDWLHDHGCRVLALMGGGPLLRPQVAHKAVYYAAKKGFWIYIGTNGRLLRPEVADRLGDAGAAVFNNSSEAGRYGTWSLALAPSPARSSSQLIQQTGSSSNGQSCILAVSEDLPDYDPQTVN